MRRPILILTHVPWETPGLIEPALGALPTVQRCVVDEPAPELPAPAELGGLIVMGGPQDANDDRGHPGLVAERRLIAECVSAEVPVLGVCLGMQLTALALGAKLHLRHGTEIGFAAVDLTEKGRRDPLLAPFAGAPRPIFLHWHSDAVELPNGAELLASTPRTPVQAFRVGSAIATQFHAEASSALLDSWLETEPMRQGLEPADIARLREDAGIHLPGLRSPALAGFGSFAAAVERRREA